MKDNVVLDIINEFTGDLTLRELILEFLTS